MTIKSEEAADGGAQYEAAGVIMLLFITVAGILYSGIVALVQEANTNLFNEDFLNKKKQQKIQEETLVELIGTDKNIADEHLEHAQIVLNKIDDALLQLYVLTSLYCLLIGMMLISFCAFVFMPNSKTALSFIFCFMYGVGVVCIITYAVFKLTTCATGRIMIKSFEQRGSGAKFAYIIGNIASLFSICLVVFAFTLIIYFTHLSWDIDKRTGKELDMTPKMYINMIHSITGYCLGICYAALFYREVTGQSCRGISIGQDLIGPMDRTTEEDTHIDNNFQMASIVTETITNNLIQCLDNISITAALLGSTLIIFSQVPTLIDSESNGHSIMLYSYMIFLIIFVPLNMIVSWIFFVDSTDEYSDNTIGSMTDGIRVQIIIQTILSFFMILFVPRYIFPRSFDIGVHDDIFYIEDITHGDIIWCIMIGLILQTCLVCGGEYLTSHSFQGTRDIAEQIRQNYAQGLILSTVTGSYAFYGITILFSTFIVISYSIAGFVGISLTTLGLWASRNFIIYSQILNTGGIFFINIVSIGGILVLSKVTQIWLWSGFTLFGFFIGSAVGYFLKGGCISIVKAVAEETHKEYKYFDPKPIDDQQREDDSKQRNIDKEDRLTQFMENKFHIGIVKCIVSVLSVGLLLGGESIFGYILGLNIVGLQITVMQIVMGNQIRSASEYNENLLTGSKDRQGQFNTREIKSYAIAIESVPGSALISYLAFNSMFVLVGSLTFGRTGILRDWLEKYVSYIPEESIVPVHQDETQHVSEVTPKPVAEPEPAPREGPERRSQGFNDEDDEFDDGKMFFFF